MYLSLELYGTLVLSDDNTEDVQGAYSPSNNGRMVLSNEAWRTIVVRNNLNINDIVMFLFHQFGENFTSTKVIHISLWMLYSFRFLATISNSFVMREMTNFVIRSDTDTMGSILLFVLLYR
jgi:hypothetical protein